MKKKFDHGSGADHLIRGGGPHVSNGPPLNTIILEILKPVKSVKLLGLNLDKKLNFESHISNLCPKACRQIHLLARLSHILNESIKMLVYNSFVECYFNYCSPIWHF